MHEIKVRFKRTEEATLSYKEALRVTVNVLRAVFDFKEEYFIEDGKVKKTTTYYTSHSWEEVAVVREATATDMYVWAIIKTLNEVKV